MTPDEIHQQLQTLLQANFNHLSRPVQPHTSQPFYPMPLAMPVAPAWMNQPHQAQQFNQMNSSLPPLPSFSPLSCSIDTSLSGCTDWTDLILGELDSGIPERIAACKRDRNYVVIECVDPLKRTTQATQDADLGYGTIRTKKQADLNKIIDQHINQNSNQFNDDSNLSNYDGNIASITTEQPSDSVEEIEAEFDAATRFTHYEQLNPLIDSQAAHSKVNPPSNLSNHSPHNPLNASSSSSSGDGKSSFWSTPHPTRRCFLIHNNNLHDILLTVGLLPSASNIDILDLFTHDGQPIHSTTRTPIAKGTSFELVVQARTAIASDLIGLTQTHIVFQFETPTRWNAAPSLSSQVIDVIADRLLDFHVQHFMTVRTIKMVLVDKTTQSLLSRESKPFYPVHLREIFDRTLYGVSLADSLPTMTGAMPPLPPSFTSVRSGSSLPKFHMPPTLIRANMRRATRAHDEMAKEVLEHEWHQFVQQVKFEWTERHNQHAQHMLHQARHLYPVDEEYFQQRKRLTHHLCNLQIGLYAEELQCQVDVRSYDMFYVELKEYSLPSHLQSVLDEPLELVALRVLGVAEQRPAVQIGQKIEMRIADEEKSFAHPHHLPLRLIAVVHSVREDTVYCTFPIRAFMAYTTASSSSVALSSHLFHVRFSLDRLPFRFMHRAVIAMHGIEHAVRWILPSKRDQQLVPVPKTNAGLPEIEPFDSKCNFEQLTAVQHIVANSQRGVPFIIFGLVEMDTRCTRRAGK